MEIGFDIISDLRLTPTSSFNRSNKVTSLYCIIAGNISSDIGTVIRTLKHFSDLYQGVFYVAGPLEYSLSDDYVETTEELLAICDQFDNVTILHHNVVIIDGIAILGANGWSSTISNTKIPVPIARLDDIAYLNRSTEKLQRHLDVKKIILVTNDVPNNSLYFGKTPHAAENQIPLDIILESDTEKKINNWIFGSYDNVVDISINNINYVNNVYKDKNSWAKRLTVTI